MALGTAPAKAVGCSYTQNMNWGWGMYDVAKGVVLSWGFFHLFFFRPVSLPHFPCTWTYRLNLGQSFLKGPPSSAKLHGEERPIF